MPPAWRFDVDRALTKAGLHLRDKGINSYDVLVIDQHLGNAGGLLLGSDVAKLIRREGFHGCIIFCSANCTASDQDFYFASGCDLIWPKPYPDAARMKHDIVEQCASCRRQTSWAERAEARSRRRQIEAARTQAALGAHAGWQPRRRNQVGLVIPATPLS